MNVTLMTAIAGYFGWGMTVGLVVGFTAIGIGLLGTPGLIVLFGMDPVTAVGTMTVGGFVMMLSSSIQHYRAGNVVPWIAFSLAITAMPTSYFTARYAQEINALIPLRSVMAFVLLLSTGLLFYRYVIMRPKPRRLQVTRWKLLVAPLLGAGLGVLIGATSISGSILILACILILRLPSPHSVGITSAVAVVSLLVASVAHVQQANVAWGVLAGLLPGVLVGSVIGAFFAGRVPRQILRIGILLVLVAAGIVLLQG